MEKKNLNTKYMTSQNYYDYINIEKCRYFITIPAEELLEKGIITDLNYYYHIKNEICKMLIEGNSKIQRKYFKSYCNRVYVEADTGLQNFQTDIKNFIIDTKIKDYDMKNCNPTLLLYLYKKHNLPHTELENYCKNRTEFLKENKTTKQKIISLFNIDKPYKNKNKSIDRLITEIFENKEELIELEKDKIHSKFEVENKENPLSTKQCSILYYYENELLQKAMCLFKDKVSIPMFDGFNGYDCDLDKLNDISKEYGIEWIEKPMNTCIQMGNVNLDLVNKILTDYKYNLLTLRIEDCDCADTVATKIWKYIKSDIVFCNDEWFVLDKHNLWIKVKKPCGYLSPFLKRAVEKQLVKEQKRLDYLKEQEDEKKVSQQEKRIKEHKKLMSRLDGALNKQIFNHLQKYLLNDEFETQLDMNPYKMFFKNGCFDIKKNSFREGIFPNDYITKRLNFNYSETVNFDNRAFIKQQLFKNCNCNWEHLDYYLSVLSYALCGDPRKEKAFYFLVGQIAGNGKSTIMEILTEILPQYVSTCNSKLLEENFDKKHKFIPIFSKYRIVWLEEMSSQKKIDTQALKILSDGASGENEVLFGTTKTLNFTAKGFLLTNHTPEFDKVDEGGMRRYRQVEFQSKFRDNLEDNIEKKEFKADKALFDKIIDMKLDFTLLLLEYANEYCNKGLRPVPKEFELAKENAMDTNDNFKTWFELNTVKQEGECLGKAEIIQKYKTDEDGKITEKCLLDKMKIMSLTYNRTKMKLRKRGCYMGVRWKTKDELKDKDMSSEEEDLMIDSDTDSDFD